VKAALALADRAYVLAEGRARLSGSAAELRSHGELTSLFLGGAGR
jgi:branched-chain amino acid transport system ATP-binding protein